MGPGEKPCLVYPVRKALLRPSGGLFHRVWTAESHFLIFLPNEAGHSLSICKKLSVWEGSEHVYPVGSEPVECCLLLLVLPPLLPNLPALRWADMKSCQSGCQSFKGDPSGEPTQRLICSALGWRCQQLPGRKSGVCLHLTSRLYHLADGEVFLFIMWLHRSESDSEEEWPSLFGLHVSLFF